MSKFTPTKVTPDEDNTLLGFHEFGQVRDERLRIGRPEHHDHDPTQQVSVENISPSSFGPDSCTRFPEATADGRYPWPWRRTGFAESSAEVSNTLPALRPSGRSIRNCVPT